MKGSGQAAGLGEGAGNGVPIYRKGLDALIILAANLVVSVVHFLFIFFPLADKYFPAEDAGAAALRPLIIAAVGVPLSWVAFSAVLLLARRRFRVLERYSLGLWIGLISGLAPLILVLIGVAFSIL